MLESELVAIQRAVASLLRGQLGYLDPGSGSYLLQLLIAGILGAAFVLRGYFGRIKDWFLGLFTGAETQEGAEAEQDEEQEPPAADSE